MLIFQQIAHFPSFKSICACCVDHNEAQDSCLFTVTRRFGVKRHHLLYKREILLTVHHSMFFVPNLSFETTKLRVPKLCKLYNFYIQALQSWEALFARWFTKWFTKIIASWFNKCCWFRNFEHFSSGQ